MRTKGVSRAAEGWDPQAPRYLITEPGVGYRFVSNLASGLFHAAGEAVLERLYSLRIRQVLPLPVESSVNGHDPPLKLLLYVTLRRGRLSKSFVILNDCSRFYSIFRNERLLISRRIVWWC